MIIRYIDCKLDRVLFTSEEQLSLEQAKEYAIQCLKESYINCSIANVFVNGELVLRNINTSC